MRKESIPYTPDTTALYACISDMPWAVYLDSGQPRSHYGRYDIIAAAPFIKLSTTGLQTTVSTSSNTSTTEQDPFDLLNTLLKRYTAVSESVDTLPFVGGAIGYFGYDLARRIEHLQSEAYDAENMPEMRIGIYDWAFVIDHRLKESWLVSYLKDEATASLWPDLMNRVKQLSNSSNAEGTTTQSEDAFHLTSDVVSNMTYSEYSHAFSAIKRFILEGDCYQVNLAQRFSAQAEGNAWLAYQQLRQISSAPFMGYLSYPDLTILSGSPERFLQVVGKHVETRPIKGTRPRSTDAEEDRQHAIELQSSLKDRAENVMIVDLLRNDLGKNCHVGTVKTSRLFSLESFANVHHLVSTVTGELDDTKTSVDLLKGCFPGGSITGAPKLRSMEIIEELEPNRRGVYCGAIGYIDFNGNMDTNIAIRTAVYSNETIRFWAGGGIVADSELAKEYRETWDKASSMLKLMQHFGGTIRDQHVDS